MEDSQKEKRGAGALFIPGGLFLGFGLGFLVHDVAAGMFLGMGAGFVGFALTLLLKKN